MDLCNFCEKLLRCILKPRDISVPREICERTSPSAADTCRFCSMIESYYQIYKPKYTSGGGPSARENYESFSNARAIEIEYLRLNTSYQVRLWPGPNPDGLVVYLMLQAKEGKIHRASIGSTAVQCGSTTSNRPSVSDHASELMRLVKPIVASCLSSHASCKESVSGKSISSHGTKLPTRIIQVNVNSDRNMVKVVERSRRIARYCALSHCWGSPDKHPFKTNRSNLGQVVHGISIDTLPKTFQHAIEMTRAMDVEYLWIDSICIVQDDEHDWLEQSAQMGEIFERAFLVIAAAGSPDSTGGLFNMFRHPELTAEFRFSQLGDRSASAFQITICNHLDWKPAHGPLTGRGWATQESLLGRRILFFMPGGMSWMCKEDGRTEAEGSWETYNHRTLMPLPQWTSIEKWLWFLELYSNTRLSILTDRLVAIEGIANELQKRSADRYHLGVWTNDLECQLIWLVDVYASAEEIPSLPSWCWASLGRPKSFVFVSRELDPTYTRVLVNMSLNRPFSTLAAQAYLRRGFLKTECWPIHDKCHFKLYEVLRKPEYGNENKILTDSNNDPRDSVFELFDEYSRFNTIGLAVLDKEVCSEIFILPLISIARETSSNLYHGPDDEPYEAPWKPKAHAATRTCIDLMTIAAGTHVEWTLLLTPVNEQEMRFKRIGVALLYPHRMKPNTGAPVTFQIE
ncbi:heterokaryon incompatibility protein-domain-containing protein [Xylariaceae sp. FL0255]|nr:heterokaryon incompatibility protein-domain-containing protein [Xylariaceae sp. FL0255]